MLRCVGKKAAKASKGSSRKLQLFPHPALQSRTGPVQGQYRVFPVYFSHTGKNLFSLQGFQVIETGFSLLGKVHREFPVFITGMGLQCIEWSTHEQSQTI